MAALLSALGVADEGFAQGWWLALVVGLVASAATALTGFLDWLQIPRDAPLWRTATTHMIVMLLATLAFAIAAIAGHAGYADREVRTGPLIVTLIGFGILAVGGWLGGAITYVHGMRVLNLVEEPAAHAATPVPRPEKEAAEKS